MKNKVIPWIMAATLVTTLSGCQLIPVEEELPVAPVVKTYQGVEHDQVVVTRGDLIATSVVQCKYQALEKENLSFRLGGEYIEGIYVEVGQEVQAGELLAELVYDDYDRLIQLCDALAMAEGVVDIEIRMSDVKRRYGEYPQEKWDNNLALKAYFEEKCGKSIYEVVK